MTPLYIAVLNGNRESVEMLLAKKNKCNMNIRDKKFGQTPLHIAALVRKFEKSFSFSKERI